MGALVVAAFFAIIVSFTSSVFPLQEQPKSEINITVPGQGVGSLRVYVNPAMELDKKHLVKQGYDYSCGSASLAIILNHYLGENFTERQVIQGLMHYGNPEQIKKRQAFSLLDMKKFVVKLGYKAEGYKAELDDLKTLTTPCIVPLSILNYRHFVVFRGIFRGHVFLADPWRGDISFTLDDFYKAWYDKVIFVVTPPEGGPTLSALKLKLEDLVYIDEDAAREAIFGNQIDPRVAAAEKEFKFMVNPTSDPRGRQYYRVHPH
ncbi:MAG: C39 family peptidase [Syntrophaceae bacterium]|nr:C39 family peptidase [Syntrophaceae bacterium]